MANREKAAPGTVAWVDLQTPDLSAARKFYGDLLGWSFVGGDTPEMGFYVTAQRNGRNAAGLARLGEGSPFPPMWSVYFAAENADDVARRVAEGGGQVVVPPMDVMEEGRMAYFSDPTGAFFGVWQGKRHQGAQVVDEPGAMVWHEVYTRDATRARRFYTQLFGLEERRLDSPAIEYWSLHRGEQTVCGLMQMTEQMPPETPAHWNTYFAVSDVDQSEKQVVALGGKVRQPAFDTPYGRMTAVADPFGAAFCLLTPPR